MIKMMSDQLKIEQREFDLRPKLDPEEFAEEYVKWTLHSRGFLSQMDLKPLLRIFGGYFSAKNYLQGIAAKSDLVYKEYVEGDKIYPYLIVPEVFEALTENQPKNADQVRVILKQKGYDGYLKEPEARSLIELTSIKRAIPEQMRKFIKGGDQSNERRTSK